MATSEMDRLQNLMTELEMERELDRIASMPMVESRVGTAEDPLSPDLQEEQAELDEKVQALEEVPDEMQESAQELLEILTEIGGLEIYSMEDRNDKNEELNSKFKSALSIYNYLRGASQHESGHERQIEVLLTNGHQELTKVMNAKSAEQANIFLQEAKNILRKCIKELQQFEEYILEQLDPEEAKTQPDVPDTPPMTRQKPKVPEEGARGKLLKENYSKMSMPRLGIHLPLMNWQLNWDPRLINIIKRLKVQKTRSYGPI